MLKNSSFSLPAWGAQEVYAALILFALTLFLHPSIAFYHEIPLDSDSLLFFYPIRALFSDDYVGFWNPYLFSGFPREANPQSQLLYPPNLIFRILPPAAGYAFLLISHLWVGAYLLYLLLRSAGLSFQPALFGAVVLLCSTFWRCKITNIGLLEGIAWIPGVMLCLLCALERRSRRSIAASALSFSLLILAGVPHTVVYCQILLISITVMYAAVHRCWYRAILTLSALNLFALIATTGLWLPAFDYSFQTQRVRIPLQDALAGSLPWSDVWKSFFGGLAQPGIQRSDPWEGTCYIGITALLFVPLGWKRFSTAIFWGFGLAFLFAVFCTTGEQGLLFPLLYHYLPGWSFLNLPNRSLVICALLLPVFAAVGLHTFLKQKAVTIKQKRFLMGLSLGAIGVTAIGCILNPAAFTSLRYSALTSTFLPGALTETAWTVFNLCFWLGLTGLCLTLYGYRYLRESALVLCLVLLVIFQSLQYSQRLFLQTTDTDSLLHNDTNSFLASHNIPNPQHKIAAFSPLIDINSDVRSPLIYPFQMYRIPELIRIHEIQGYDPMFPKRYGELIRQWSGIPPNSDPTRIIRMHNISKGMLDFFHVKYLIGDPGQQTVYSGNAVLSEPGVIGTQLERAGKLKQIHFRWLLTNAFHLPHKTQVGNVRVHHGTRTVDTFPIIAGEQIANYITERAGRHARHRPAQAFRWFPLPSTEGYTRVQQFLGEYPIRSHQPIDGISIELTLPNIQLITLQINVVYQTEMSLNLLMDHDYAPVLENPDIHVPAYITHRIADTSQWREYIESLKQSPRLVRHSVFITETKSFPPLSPQEPLHAAIRTYRRDHSDRMRFQVEADQNAVLVIPENFSPYWQARINRTPVQPVRANHAFMAIPFPAGKHTIILQYRPVLFYYGCVISAIGWITMLVGLYPPTAWLNRFMDRGERVNR